MAATVMTLRVTSLACSQWLEDEAVDFGAPCANWMKFMMLPVPVAQDVLQCPERSAGVSVAKRDC